MEKIYTGKVLDDLKAFAISEANELGVASQDIKFEILEEPVKKLFSKKGDYKLKVTYAVPEAAAVAETEAETEAETVSETVTAAPETASAPETEAASSEKVQLAVQYLERVLAALGAKDFRIDVIEKEEITVLDIVGDKLGIVIGRRGETLDSLQYLAILASNRGDEHYCRITVDCNGYRDKREETLKALAERTANKVLRQGRRITLEPMNPYERRIIHSKVAEIEGVYSNSIGEEPYRKVVISANQRHSDSKRNDRRGSKKSSGGANRNYKQSTGFSTSFEREYKRSVAPLENEEVVSYSQETVEAEKNATLYGKIEF